jgi:acetylornithine deacetylase/succinyl-diaminopimelate desuccinylase-like protein
MDSASQRTCETVHHARHAFRMSRSHLHQADRWKSSADAVIAHLPELHDEYERTLAQLVAVPAVSALGGDLRPAAELLCTVMQRSGLDATVENTPGAPIVVGSYVADASLPTVLIYGHYDVQPVEPLDAWSTDPFSMAVANGRFLGRGTADNKAQHLAQLMAVRALLDVDGSLPVNVQMVVEGGEEVGSPHLDWWLTRNQSRLRADVAYTSDGALHPSGRPVVVCGARGLAYLDITLTVAAGDRHSGNFSGVTRNAAEELINALFTLWDRDGTVLVKGFADDVTPYEAGRRSLAHLPLDLSDLRRDELRPGVATSERWFDRVLLSPSLNICSLDAGWTGPGMKTIIPATARAKLDARLVPEQSPGRIAELVREHLRQTCPDIQVELTATMEPSRTSVELPYVSKVAEAVRHGWGMDPFIYPNLAGSLPDAAFTATLGIPSVIVPYGNADQRNHSANENMEVANFRAGARTLVSVLCAMRPASL